MNSLKRGRVTLPGRLLLTALFFVLGAVSASAYTVVMRDGRRVEIPNQFILTSSTLTYVAGPGIQVTIQLNTVDITATERANGEAKGSFMLKATSPAVPPAGAQQTPRKAERSITNQDLESYRRERVENEKAYEQRRKELGLPSAEERRREAAAIEERTLEQARNMRAQQELEEVRRETDALRAQSEANEAQIEFMRRNLYNFPFTDSFGVFPTLGPFDTVGFGTAAGSFGRSRLFASEPLLPFLSTPITPFPRVQRVPFVPAFRGHFRPRVFVTPGRRLHR